MLYNKRVFGKTKTIDNDELIKKFANEKLDYIDIAVLFGSRAMDSSHIKSDYDFAILVKKTAKAPWGIISKAWNDIGDILSLPEYDYDIVDLRDADKNIINSIKENHILLKGDESEFQRVLDSYS